MVGNEEHWTAIALGGFVFAALAFGIGAVVAARRAGLPRFIAASALGGAGFVATVVASFLTYRPPPQGARIGEPIVPLTWGMAWGFYAFGVLLLAAVLTARSPSKK